MKEYFTGHKDSVAINEYLNELTESSNDFQVIFQLRTMGEEFVDGTLSIDEVKAFSKILFASSKAEAFIRQMKCYTFYSVLCDIALARTFLMARLKKK